MGARRAGGLQNVYLSITGLGRCPGRGQQRRMRGGWLRGGDRGGVAAAISQIPRVRDPGSQTSREAAQLKAHPSSLPLPHPRWWRALCLVQPS